MKATLVPGIAGKKVLQVDEGRCIAFVQGRKVRCAFSVRDEVEECGSGVHVRFVVDAEKTRQRLAQKRAQAGKG
jgi:predicted thioesterase